MIENSENRINVLKKLIEQTNQTIDKLSGDIITLSYPLEVEIGDENTSRYGETQLVKGTRVECRVKLDEKGQISQVLAAIQVTYEGANKSNIEGIRYDEKIKETKEISPDNVDMDKLQQSWSFYRENGILQTLEDNKKTYQQSIDLLETAERIYGGYIISQEGMLYDEYSRGGINLGGSSQVLPTGEKIPIVFSPFSERVKLSAKLRDDLLLAKKNNGFERYGPAISFIIANNSSIETKNINGDTIFIYTPVTFESLIKKYNMPREELESLARDYEKDQRKLTELVREAEKIMEFNKNYNANMLLPIETKMLDLQTQMQKYSGFAGFFRKIFKHKEYETTKFGLENSKRQMEITKVRQAEEDQEYETNQVRYPQIEEEFDRLKDSLEQNVDGAEAKRCVDLMKYVERIREILEEKDKYNMAK